MEVRIFVGAEAAYAFIRTPDQSMDVRLSPGKPAAKSLHDTAIDLREQATKLLQRAEFIERAATVLEKA
jgi:hypothetical protein